jgi:rsbT antagonist protein RsbS
MERTYGERIPILKMGEFLLVTIQVDLHDQMVLNLQNDLLEHIRKTGAHGVLLDISALEIVDSYIGRMVGNIAKMSKILDAETVLVGMRPTVAITLVELGVSLQGVRTALNLEKGMELLQSLMMEQREQRWQGAEESDKTGGTNGTEGSNGTNTEI